LIVLFPCQFYHSPEFKGRLLFRFVTLPKISLHKNP